MYASFVGDFGTYQFWNTNTAFATQPAVGTYPTSTDVLLRWGSGDDYYILISKLTPTSTGDGLIDLTSVSTDSAVIANILADLGLTNASKLNLITRDGLSEVALDIVCGTRSETQASMVVRVSLDEYAFNVAGGITFRVGSSNPATLGVLPVTTSDNGYNVYKTYTIYSNTMLDVYQRCAELLGEPLLSFATMQGGNLPRGVISTYSNYGQLAFSGIPLSAGTYSSYWMAQTFVLPPSGVGGGGNGVGGGGSRGGDGDQWSHAGSSSEENEGYDWTGTNPQPPIYYNHVGGANDPWDNDGDPQDPNDQSGAEGRGSFPPYVPPIVIKIVFSISADLTKYSYGSVLLGLGANPSRWARCASWPSGKWMKIDASGTCWITLDSGATWRVMMAGDVGVGCVNSWEWNFNSVGGSSAVSGLISDGRPVCGTMITESAKTTGFITSTTAGLPPFYWEIPQADGVLNRKVLSVSYENRDNLRHLFFSDIAVASPAGILKVKFWTDEDDERIADEEISSTFAIYSTMTSGGVMEVRGTDGTVSEDYDGGQPLCTTSGSYVKPVGSFRYTILVETPANAFETSWHCEIDFIGDGQR